MHPYVTSARNQNSDASVFSTKCMEGDAKGEKRPEIRERRANRSSNCERGQTVADPHSPSPQLSFRLAVSDAPLQERSELLDKIPSTEQSFGSTRCPNSWRVPPPKMHQTTPASETCGADGTREWVEQDSRIALLSFPDRTRGIILFASRFQSGRPRLGSAAPAQEAQGGLTPGAVQLPQYAGFVNPPPIQGPLSVLLSALLV